MHYKQQETNTYTDFYYHFFRNILVVSLPLLVISFLVLSISHSSARISSSDNLAISVPSSCTLSSSVDSEHSASIVNGRYEEGIGTTTLSTFCNDKNGYSVYAIGDSLNSEGNNTLIGSNGSNIGSGTATSGNTSNWAMKLSLKAGDTSTTPPSIIDPFTNYSTVPTYWTRVATIPSSTTDMVKGSNFTTTYATYISPTQAAGTYLGQVKYLLTHPSTTAPTIIMQDVANWKNDLGEEESLQATDVRDGKKYWITKLKDGHIWMTQNLDLDISANATFNSNTTDLNVIYDSIAGQYAEYNTGYSKNNGVIYWEPASTAATINFEGNTVAGWIDSDTAPYSANKTDSTETGHASLGNWYNWTAAIASNDSSTLTQNTVNDISQNPKNSICPKGWRLPTISNQSEATIGSTNEFARLNALYDNVLDTPLFFVKAGYVDSNGLNSVTSNGIYTSSTSYMVNSVWGSALRDKKFTIDWWENAYSGRRGGWSIRCIAH